MALEQGGSVLAKQKMSKHLFTQIGERKSGYCGHEYCNSSNCRTWYEMPDGKSAFKPTHLCSCGFSYVGDKSKEKELEHVLNAEGLYE